MVSLELLLSDRRGVSLISFPPTDHPLSSSRTSLHIKSPSPPTPTLDQIHAQYPALDHFLSQYPLLQSLYSAMRTYITPKILLLFVFGLLLVARGVVSDEKTPPATLQIGITPSSILLDGFWSPFQCPAFSIALFLVRWIG
jgi:hypothetical protein